MCCTCRCRSVVLLGAGGVVFVRAGGIILVGAGNGVSIEAGWAILVGSGGVVDRSRMGYTCRCGRFC